MDKIGVVSSRVVGCCCDRDGLWLALQEEGLCRVEGRSVTVVHAGRCGGVAQGPGDALFYTIDRRAFLRMPSGPDRAQDITALFGGPPAQDARVACTRDGSIWVSGCPMLRLSDGSSKPVPMFSVTDATPVPHMSDQYGNHWALSDQAPGAVLVLTASDPTTWQTVQTPEAYRHVIWEMIVTDETGFIWLYGDGQLLRHNPRKQQMVWEVFPETEDISPSEITALVCSPDGRLLVGLTDGRLATLDITAAGDPVIRFLDTGFDETQPMTFLYADSIGAIWFIAGETLYRHPSAAAAPQNNWAAKSRLPCGNHDIFAVTHHDALYFAGGLTHYWSYPAEMHVFDELFRYDSSTELWTTTDTMPFPRCYNGIAVLDDRIWIVGGAANLSAPEDPYGERIPLDSVIWYDPAQQCRGDGPSLHTERIEPVVDTINGRIYAVGGADGQDRTLASVESLGTGEPAWRREPDLPEPMRQSAGCVLEGLLYICGKAGFFAYDPISARWITDLPQPDPLPQAPLMATHQGRIWVLGGYPIRESRIYDPISKLWRDGPDLPVEQSWGAACSFRDRLMVIGGAHRSETHESFIFDDRVFALRESERG